MQNMCAQDIIGITTTFGKTFVAIFSQGCEALLVAYTYLCYDILFECWTIFPFLYSKLSSNKLHPMNCKYLHHKM